jgi:hypothetical protein
MHTHILPPQSQPFHSYTDDCGSLSTGFQLSPGLRSFALNSFGGGGGDIWGWTQGFILARRELYQMSYICGAALSSLGDVPQWHYSP